MPGDVAALAPKHRKTLNGHLRALYEYHPPIYPGRVTLFRVQAIPLRRAYDPELGWGRLAEGGVEVKMIPGGHHSLLEHPHVEGLADELGACLELADADLKTGAKT